MIADNVADKLESGSAKVAEEWRRELSHVFERYGITSPIEQVFLVEWAYVQFDSPIKVGLIPQKKVGNYYVDFAVDLYGHFLKTSTNVKNGSNLEKISDELPKIAVELDGHWHEKTKLQVERDKKRERILQKNGYQVIRFSGSEITRNPAQCVDEVLGTVMPIIHKVRSKYANKGGW